MHFYRLEVVRMVLTNTTTKTHQKSSKISTKGNGLTIWSMVLVKWLMLARALITVTGKKTLEVVKVWWPMSIRMCIQETGNTATNMVMAPMCSLRLAWSSLESGTMVKSPQESGNIPTALSSLASSITTNQRARASGLSIMAMWLRVNTVRPSVPILTREMISD